ncbi:cell division protein SepF [Candidatus Woesearchaeota archaeon]|nr:cell division protein SepF [Candidatus Woesearchaeota archaeon]
MAGFFSKLKEKFVGEDISSEILEGSKREDYVELDAGEKGSDITSKVMVRPFVLEDFESIKEILDSLREGHTIALINIKALKEKDMVELKRAINKLKKTCDAIDGDLAGFGDDWIAAVPSFARIHRTKQEQGEKQVPEVTEFEE